MSKVYDEAMRIARSRPIGATVFNCNALMQFDVEYEVELLPTEPQVLENKRYKRKEHVFYVSYQKRHYQLVLTETMSADLHKRHGDVYEKFKDSTIYIKRTKVGRNHYYDIRCKDNDQLDGLSPQSTAVIQQMGELSEHVSNTTSRTSEAENDLDDKELERMMEESAKLLPMVKINK